MKKTIITLALLVFLFSAFTQEKKEKGEKQIVVPEMVKKAFMAKYQTATKVEWGLEKEGEFEAEFKMNKVEMSVVFDEKGNVLEVETEIKEAALPQAIKTTLTKDFEGYKLDEVEKAEANGETTYEMEARKDKTKFELVFSPDGKLIKKEAKNDKEEDSDE